MIDEAHNLLAAMARGNSTTVDAVPEFLSFMRKILEPNDFTFLVQRAFGALDLCQVMLEVQPFPDQKINAIKALRSYTAVMAEQGYGGYGGSMGLKEAKDTAEGVDREQLLNVDPAPKEVVMKCLRETGLDKHFRLKLICA
jgi:hypothetical protein